MVDIEFVNILIVEDEPYVRTIVRRILARLQINNVHEAADGGEGLMQTLRIRPHLMLCDVHMDPVDGLTFLSTLRTVKVEAIRDTPVILLTSDSNQDVVMRARDLRVSGYMVKPVSVNDMKKNLSRVLGLDFPMEH